MEFTQQLRAAIAPQTGPDTLRELAQSEFPQVLFHVARHPSTPPDALETLASRDHADYASAILRAVASNRNTPPTALATLSRAGYGSVRGAVVRHPQTPKDLAADLMRASIGESVPGWSRRMFPGS